MGNCIGSACALPSSNKKVRPDEDDQQLKAPSPRKQSSGPCRSPETPLVSGLSGGPLPLPALLKSVEVQLDSADGSQRMKIVVNKKQLKLLIASLEELKSRHVVIQSIGKRDRKWRPSLATIPEL